MPSIDTAVSQASRVNQMERFRPASSNPQGMMSAPSHSDVVDSLIRCPMPSFQTFSDPVRQSNRQSVVPQYRAIPPTPTPATNITVSQIVSSSGVTGAQIVYSSGGGSIVSNTPGSPGSPGTPSGGIPGPPSVSGDLTAADPLSFSSIRQVLGGPTIVSISTFGGSGASHSRGVVPDPGAVAGTTKFLREDSSWNVPPVFIASGASHAVGYVPDPGAVAGTTKFLREDATWATVSGTPPATLVGQVLFSVDGATFEAKLPVTDPVAGWLVDGGTGLMMVV